jgi:hypothetical protein
MAFQILDSVLPFAVHRDIQILDDLRARCLCLIEMGIDIFNEHVSDCVHTPACAGLARPGRAPVSMTQASPTF